MRWAIRYSVVATGSALVLLGLSYWQLGASSRAEFAGNVLLNVTAEFVGAAVGLLLAFRLASKIAAEKLLDLSPSLLRLVKRLREGNTITGEAARECVICAVRFLSDDHIVKLRTGAVPADPVKCDVCGLSAEINKQGATCSRCGLSAVVWWDVK